MIFKMKILINYIFYLNLIIKYTIYNEYKVFSNLFSLRYNIHCILKNYLNKIKLKKLIFWMKKQKQSLINFDKFFKMNK